VTIVSDVEARSGLQTVRLLSRRLATADVRYCHWKSNEHLRAAVEGDTDLDLLFDRVQRRAVTTLLEDVGFIHCPTPWFRRYPDIEDFVAVDLESGRLVHVHAHFDLVLGSTGVKEYRAPWAAMVIERRALDPETGIYIADAAQEVVLLLTREALKLKARGRALSTEATRELAWLMQRSSLEAVREAIVELLGDTAVEPVMRVLRSGADYRHLAELRSEILPILKPFRRLGAAAVLTEPPRRRWAARIARLAGRVRRPVPSKRTVGSDGIIIALTGVDGSGKSTVTGLIAARLSSKLDVVRIYFGSGSGPRSLLRIGLEAVSRLARRAGGRSLPDRDVGWQGRTSAGADGGRSSAGVVRRTMRCLRAIAIAREKRARLRWARRARCAGAVVICDRYPQADVAGYNDGPLLGDLLESPWRALRAIGRWERACYERARVCAPDLVVRLNVVPAVARSRRPEMAPDRIARKIVEFRAIRYPPTTVQVDVEASQPVDRVVVDVMKSFGQVLRARASGRLRSVGSQRRRRALSPLANG